MMNLTGRTLRLENKDGEETEVTPGGPRAWELVHERIVDTAETFDAGAGPMAGARVKTPDGAAIERVNRLIEDYVHARLRERVVAPYPRFAGEAGNGKPAATRLLRKEEPRDEDARGAGYTLFLDYAGIATDNPSRQELGHAHTWAELQWMARGAERLERGGRLWARDDERGTMLSMGEMLGGGPPRETPQQAAES